jgi:hypothetical protein
VRREYRLRHESSSKEIVKTRESRSDGEQYLKKQILSDSTSLKRSVQGTNRGKHHANIDLRIDLFQRKNPHRQIDSPANLQQRVSVDQPNLRIKTYHISNANPSPFINTHPLILSPVPK